MSREEDAGEATAEGDVVRRNSRARQIFILAMIFTVGPALVGNLLTHFDGKNGSGKPEDYAFQHLDEKTGEPLLWRTCTLTWSLDAEAGPQGTEKTVQTAFDIIAKESGLKFKRVMRGAQISIKVFEKFDGEEVGGVAQIVPIYDPESGLAVPAYSEVVIFGGVFEDLSPGVDRRDSRGGLVIHEVLHALGLGHVEYRGSIMYPKILKGELEFSPGDLVALKTIGTECSKAP